MTCIEVKNMASTVVPAVLNIQGIRLVNLAMEEVISAIESALFARQPTRISFVNDNCVNIAARDATYRAALADTDWPLIDGVGMRIAGKLMSQPVREKFNCTDLFPHLCATLARQQQRLFLYGARPGVAAAVAMWAHTRYPNLKIVGTQHGYHRSSEESQIVADICASDADVVLVALGAPRQEAWIARNMRDTGATIAIGVGDLFDHYSGRIAQAPAWLRRCGLGWTYQLAREPRRTARSYLIGKPQFLGRIALGWLRERNSPRPASLGAR